MGVRIANRLQLPALAVPSGEVGESMMLFWLTASFQSLLIVALSQDIRAFPVVLRCKRLSSQRSHAVCPRDGPARDDAAEPSQDTRP